MVNMSTIRLAAWVFFAALLLARPAIAQWRVAQATPAGTDARIDIAIVENDSGHSLRLFSDETQNVRATQAEFTLGKTGQGRNRKLHRIMNGDSIIFRYRLGGGNYRETRFTLRGSKYALTTAVEVLEVGVDE
jgi:hypothetical protein